MTIDMNQINKISKIEMMLEQLQQQLSDSMKLEKRWFNTSEIANYTGYAKETIQTKAKRGEFKKGVHYFKKGKNLFFDKLAVDRWMMEQDDTLSTDEIERANHCIDSIVAEFAA